MGEDGAPHRRHVLETATLIARFGNGDGLGTHDRPLFHRW